MSDWQSEPLLMASLVDRCGDCGRLFRLYAYDPRDYEKQDKNLSWLLRRHRRNEHEEDGANGHKS